MLQSFTDRWGRRSILLHKPRPSVINRAKTQKNNTNTSKSQLDDAGDLQDMSLSRTDRGGSKQRSRGMTLQVCEDVARELSCVPHCLLGRAAAAVQRVDCTTLLMGAVEVIVQWVGVGTSECVSCQFGLSGLTS